MVIQRRWHADAAAPGRGKRWELTPEGFVVFRRAVLTRPGVLDYADPAYPDGVRREWRPAEEVLAPESLASMEGKPVVWGHPDDGEVSAETARSVSVGHVQNVIAGDDGLPMGDVWVTDATTIDRIVAGEATELSPGYHSQDTLVSGVSPAGEPYDVIQRLIRYNHLAIVGAGRAGSLARLVLDQADTPKVHEMIPNQVPTPAVPAVAAPATITAPVAAPPAAVPAAPVAPAVVTPPAAQTKTDEQWQSKLDQVMGEKVALQAKVDELQAKVDMMEAQAEVDAADVELVTDEDDELVLDEDDQLTMDEDDELTLDEELLLVDPTATTFSMDSAHFIKAHRHRSRLEKLAKVYKVDAADLPNSRLARAIVKRHLGKAYKADCSDSYVRAAVVQIAKQRARAGTSRRSVGRAHVNRLKNDAANRPLTWEDGLKARQARHEQQGKPTGK